MGNNNGPIRARMFVGGLKSLFIDMAETLDQVEKTGTMPVDMLQSLLDVKAAIDMTLIQLTKTQMRCCEHAPACSHEEECEDCGEGQESCECYNDDEDDMGDDEEDDDEEDLEEEEVPVIVPVKKSKAKVVKSKLKH